ncbi:polysaccharide deacetylase family protein [bacterium]|nr:polysaccharide deacetylase family protein [bacterium]
MVRPRAEMRVLPLILCALLASPLAAATPPRLVEPALRLPAGPPGQVRVALTFDACEGVTDPRILDALIAHDIPATVFVTGRWLARNAEAFARMRARPDLFEIEDHGARHLPAVDFPTLVYGIKAAGSPGAVVQEVSGGAAAITAAGGPAPHWFRGATAKYDTSSIAEINGLGLQVAGYSLSGDGGATFSRAKTARQIATARDGDVILSHINQPRRPAGAGVVDGILQLQARGVTFVRLQDAFGPGDATGRAALPTRPF